MPITQLLGEQSLVLIVEDVHWADETTLELLHSLARTATREPLLLVLTFRSDELSDPLRGLLSALDRERLAVQLTVQRLRPDELDALLRAILHRPSRGEFLDLLYSLTDGNPFFAEEVLRALVGTGDLFVQDGAWQRKPIRELRVPRSVDDAVQRRMAQLSPGAREVVSLAAVTGRRFDFELLENLSGCAEPQLVAIVEELIAAGLVAEETADQLAFRHALTRQAIYASLLGRERRALHRKVAEVLVQRRGALSEEDAADLAYHYAEAAQWDLALAYARQAGERALRMYAPRAAVEQLTRAVHACSALGQRPDAELLRLRGQAFDLLGRFEPAEADFTAAREAARAANDRAAEWRVLLDLSLLWAGRSYERTGAYASEALELARTIGDAWTLAQTLNRVGNWHSNRDQIPEALHHHQEALQLFEQLGDERGRAETLDYLGMASSASAARLASYYGEAIPLLRRLDDRPRLVIGLVMRMLCNGAYLNEASPLADVSSDEAKAYGEEALRIARDIGWPAGESFVLWETALRLGPRGEYAEALRYAQAGLALATEIDHRQWMTGGRLTLGGIYLDILALRIAEELLDSALSLAHELGSLNFSRISSANLATLYVIQRRFDEAERVLDAALPTDALMTSLGLRNCWLARAMLCVARDEPRTALDILERLVATADEGVMPRIWHIRGDALVRLGQAEEARRVLEAGRSQARRQQFRGQLWRIDASLARVLRGLGHREEADRVLAEARATLQDLAANIDDQGLREGFLRESAAWVPAAPAPTARQATKQRFAGLTARERAVARLVARGSSNRAIAEQLIVGERTVESYVGNILTKLGFNSRTQIAAWVVESGLAEADD